MISETCLVAIVLLACLFLWAARAVLIQRYLTVDENDVRLLRSLIEDAGAPSAAIPNAALVDIICLPDVRQMHCNNRSNSLRMKALVVAQVLQDRAIRHPTMEIARILLKYAAIEPAEVAGMSLESFQRGSQFGNLYEELDERLAIQPR